MKKLIFLGVIVLLATISQSSNPFPTGYEYFRHQGKDHIHTWNNNPLGVNESNIWFEDRNNNPYVQFFNGEDYDEALERAEWVQFKYGFGYYNNGFNTWLSNHLNNAEHNISSDNLTYWDMNVYKCLDEFCAGWERYQGVNDKYMENTAFFTADGFSFDYNLSYLWGFEDIDIKDNGEVDSLKYCYMALDFGNASYEKCDTITLDNSSEFVVYDVLRVYLFDEDMGHFVHWDDDVQVNLRYNDGEFMLEAPLGYFDNWSGRKEVPMYWIDYDISYEWEADLSNDVSGFIYFLTSLNNYYIYKNANPYVYDNYYGSAERRGYAGFNLTYLPDNITVNNITSVQFYHYLNTKSSSQPTDWKTRFGVATDIGTLDYLDWNKSSLAKSVDWSNAVYCGNNGPCTTWIPFPTFGLSDIRSKINAAKDGDVIFTVQQRDSSLYKFGDTSWSHITTLGGRTPSVLEINFTVPDYNVSLVIDELGNGTVIYVNGTTETICFHINGTSQSPYMLDECRLNSWRRTVYNYTDVEPSEAFGYGTCLSNFTKWGWDDDGIWDINVTCTDLWGKQGKTSFWFNISQYIEIVENIELMPKKQVYPILALFMILFIAAGLGGKNEKEQEANNS